MFDDKCDAAYLMKKTIKVLRSCENLDQLLVAVKFLRRAIPRHRKLVSPSASYQFGIDMLTLAEEILNEFVREKKTQRSPGNPFVNSKYNPFIYPVMPKV